MVDKKAPKYCLIRDLPPWWSKFTQFCRDRNIPIRTALLWLAVRFMKDEALQGDYAAWNMKKGGRDGGD